MGRLQQQKEEKMQSLLLSARELFLEKGVAKTSVDEIARRANVAKGTFYLYFHDKEDLLHTLVLRICSRVLDDAYRHMCAHRTPSFSDNVILFVDHIIEHFRRNKLQLRLIERNFTWPMIAADLPARTDPLWRQFKQELLQTPFAQSHTSEEMFRIFYVLMEMCGSVCYSSIIEGKPASIEEMKPILYSMVRKSLV